MMATDSSPLEVIDETNDTNVPTKSKRKPKSSKRNLQSTNSDGIKENGNGSLSEPMPSKSSETKSSSELNLETSIKTISASESLNSNHHSSDLKLHPVASIKSDSSDHENSGKFQQIELTTITDDEENNKKEEVHYRRSGERVIHDNDPIVSSSTTLADNDIIEIHEFSLADIDAYLDIYFEILRNRLVHYIGGNDLLQQFRVKMKDRISTNPNSREYQNVLLGKMNGEVVAAVTLSFPGESTTISNDDILPEANSCIASLRRRMIRKANYIPTNMDECYIEMIGVRSAYQNRGIGVAMLECIEHFARQAGALLLTVHTNGPQLVTYFQRFGFSIDHSDNSAFWKWTVERQSVNKMSKFIPSQYENNDSQMDNTNSYVNESMVSSEME